MLRFSALRAAVLPARKAFAHLLASAGLLPVAVLLLSGLTEVAHAQPAPVVTIAKSKVVSIGEDFTLTLTFANAGDVGFGPYVDLFLPAIGIDGEAPPALPNGPCDGITFLSAEGHFAAPPIYPLLPTTAVHSIIPGTFTCATAATTGVIGPVTSITAHPHAGLGASIPPSGSLNTGASTVIGPAGYELVVLDLPFTSYYPTQGPITIEVKLRLSNFADAGGVLSVYARGGFQYDNSAGTSPTSVQGPFASVDITPNVFTLTKGCVQNGAPCHENETATGPSYPFDYVIAADVDTGLSVNDLTFNDCLDNNLQFVAASTAGQIPGQILNAPTPPGPPGGCVQATFAGTITGVAGPDPEASLTIPVYIPEFHADGTPVLTDDCGLRQGFNHVDGTGTWTPLDPRDLGGDNSVGGSADHMIVKKCLAVQKSVSPAVATPGTVLTYTVNFQVSDFFTIGNLILKDLLSDGQSYVANSATLTIGGNSGPVPSGFVAPSATPQCSTATPWGTPDFPPYPWLTPPTGGGLPETGTIVDFNLSGALAALGSPWSAVLTGGTTGTLTFQAEVDDAFHCPNSQAEVTASGKDFVDKFDRIFDYLTIAGDVLDNTTHDPAYPLGHAEDDSGTKVDIAPDSIAKCVYQIDRTPGSTSGDVVAPPGYCNPVVPIPSPLPKVAPGDRITFRILKTLPAGDWENLKVTDFLTSPLLTFSSWTQGPSDTCPGLANDPFNPLTNSIDFLYPTSPSSNNTSNTPCTIDLLVTATVASDPFPDKLVRNNQASECEDNSLGETICQTAVAPFEVGEPVLNIRKGAISACQPLGTGFCPPAPPPYGTFNPPGVGLAGVSVPGSQGLRFQPSLVSPPGVGSNVIVDAGDVVTFATVVENTGSSPTGAFDVKIKDTPPPSFGTANLFVSDGAGSFFECDSAATTNHGVGAGCAANIGGFFDPGLGIYLDDQTGPSAADAGGLDRFGPTGANIAVATYDMKVPSDVVLGACFTNVTQLLNYAGIEDGPNHVDPLHPLQATAQVCIRKPSIVKSIVSTSEQHTTNGSGGEHLAIGEIVRYRLKIALPEGSAPSFQVLDFLAPGLGFMNDGTAKIALVSDTVGSVAATGVPALVSSPAPTTPTFVLPAADIGNAPTCGPNSLPGPLAFNLGNVTNGDADPNQEFVVIDFNALVCNTQPNVDGTALPNRAEVRLDTNGDGNPDPIGVVSNTVPSVVVEPKINITKSVAPGEAPNTYKYTLSLTNVGDADAFEVVVQDPLTACTKTALQVFLPTGVNAVAYTLTGGGIDVRIPKLLVGQALNVSYTVALDKGCDPKSSCPVVNLATVTWTSLPGEHGTSPNPTGSSTPGASGAPDGERNGSTAFGPNPPNSPDLPNNYHATAKVNLCGTLCVEKLNAANGQQLSGWNITAAPSIQPFPLLTGSAPVCTPQFVGSYTLSETLQSNWAPAAPPTQTATVTSDQTTTVTFVNKPKLIDLTIKKSVVAGPNAPAFNLNAPTFPFTLSCSSTGPLPPFGLNNGGGHVQSVPAVDSCVLTESMPLNWPTPDGCWWVVTYPGGSGIMPPGPVQISLPPGTSSVSVTNELDCKKGGGGGEAGKITLIKKVDNQTGADLTGLHYPVVVSCESGFTDTTIDLLEGQPVDVNGIPLGVDCKVGENIDQITQFSEKICPPGTTLQVTQTNDPAGYVHAGDTVVVYNVLQCLKPVHPVAACARTEGEFICNPATGQWTYSLHVGSPNSWINTITVLPLTPGIGVVGGPFSLNPAAIPLTGSPGSSATLDICGFNAGEAGKGGPYDCCHITVEVTIPKTACGRTP